MTKEEFLTLCEKGPVCLDGATGSNLQKSGMPLGVCPEKWITENPEALIGLQHSFLEAGASIIYAPTFTANRVKLSEYGLEGSLTELNHSLIGFSREAIKRFEKENGSSSPKYVAGDLTMTGVALKPTGPMDFEELIEIYKEQVSALLSGGVDLFVVETMMSLNETRAAVIAIKESCDLPIMATLTFEADGKSLYGTDPLSALISLQSLGVSAFGANCSTGPKEMRGIIERLAEYAEIPIIAKPNAGLPEVDEKGETAYRLSPEDFAEDMKGILEAGANIVGGCCGTTPKHIAALSAVLASCGGFDGNAGKNAERGLLCSERKAIEIKRGDRLHIIGERINPTGKKKLQAELKASSFELVRSYAESQEEKGASLIIVNTGMPGVDEKALLLKAIEEVGGVRGS